MAEAAIDYSRAARLRQSRIAAQRNASGISDGVVSLPDIRAKDASKVRESELYNIPRTPKEVAANDNLRFQKEQENKAKWLRDKVNSQAKLRQFIAHPPNIDSSEELRQDERFQEAQRAYQEESASIIARDRRLPSSQRNRLQTAQQLKQKAKQFEARAKQIKEAIDKLKKAKDVGWTTYEVGSLAETEGALLETVNVSGILTSIYRGVKTILFPSALTSDDPDAGQFFKGMLSFLEPTSLRVKDPTAWVAALHAVYGYFLLFIIFVLANLAIIIFGILLLGIGETLNYFEIL